MKFEKFPSIINENPKNLQEVIENPKLMAADWFMTEKIHGANFSLDISSDGIRYGKRSGLFENENFFNYRRFFTEEREAQLIAFFNEHFATNVKTLRIRGELFGGGFDGCKKIQPEMDYGMDISFRAFSALFDVGGENPHETSFQSLCGMCAGMGLEVVPIIAIGKFEELYAMHKEQPTMLGKTGIVAEGVVLTCHLSGETPVRVKRRNDNFLEAKANHLKADMSAELIAEAKENLRIATVLQDFITPQRMANVISHDGFGLPNFGDIMKAFFEDLFADARKDAGVVISENTERALRKSLNKQVADLVRNHFAE